MKRTVFLSLLVLAVFLSSCSDYSDFSYEYYEGEKIDKEELSKRLEDSFTQAEEEVYYFTASGNVYHKSENCRYLKDSKKIISGGIKKANESGKQKPCSACFE